MIGDFSNVEIMANNFRDQIAQKTVKQFEEKGGHKKIERTSTNDAATVMINSGELSKAALKGIEIKGINKYNHDSTNPLFILNLPKGNIHDKSITEQQANEIQRATKRPVIYSKVPVNISFDAQGTATVSTIDRSSFRKVERVKLDERHSEMKNSCLDSITIEIPKHGITLDEFFSAQVTPAEEIDEELPGTNQETQQQRRPEATTVDNIAGKIEKIDLEGAQVKERPSKRPKFG